MDGKWRYCLLTNKDFREDLRVLSNKYGQFTTFNEELIGLNVLIRLNTMVQLMERYPDEKDKAIMIIQQMNDAGTNSLVKTEGFGKK